MGHAVYQQAGGVLFAVRGVDRDERHWCGHRGRGRRGPVHRARHRRVPSAQGRGPAPELSDHRPRPTTPVSHQLYWPSFFLRVARGHLGFCLRAKNERLTIFGSAVTWVCPKQNGTRCNSKQRRKPWFTFWQVSWFLINIVVFSSCYSLRCHRFGFKLTWINSTNVKNVKSNYVINMFHTYA